MTDDVSDVSADKPPFDPSKPFTPVAAAAGGDKPPFDPTKPFKPVEQPPGPMTGSDVASGVVENFIPSAKQFGSDVVRPIMHPIETATNLKDLALGLLEKSGAIGTIFPSAGGGHEQYADAMGQYLKDRYGGWENIKRSVAKDPVGVLSDASMILSGGETAAGRLPGILGTTGRAMGTVGRAVDPLMAPVNAAKLATQGVGHFATHTGPEALQNAYRTGVEGGDAAEVLRDNMRGNVPTSNVVDIARQGVSEMAKDRAQQYVSDMAAIGKRPEIMDWDKVTEALQKNATVKKFEGIDISPETAAVRDRITSAIEKWGELPPDIYHTAAGFDALKQMIGEMRDAQPYGTPGRNVADRAYNAIRAEIIKQAPEYAKAMKNYSEASDLIREMNTTLSLRPGTSIDTSLRKLQSIMRNNVNTNYGRRMELGQLLEENGATHLMAALSGQALNTWAPRGLGKYVAGSTLPAIGAGLSSGHVLPAIGAAAVLPFMSPRLMGEGAHFIGRTVGRALDRSGQALSGIGGNRALGNLLYRAGRTANPEEGQYRTGGRIAPRAFRPRKAGGGELSDDDQAAMSPETYANPFVKQAIGNLATLPRRAIENSQHSLDTGTYDPSVPIEAATLPMGTGAIAGLPVRAGETALGAGPIRAYHGSPHDFDRFDISKIGEGQGQQTYGHGLYFAENENVARGYRDSLSDGRTLVDGKPLSVSRPDLVTRDFLKRIGNTARTSHLDYGAAIHPDDAAEVLQNAYNNATAFKQRNSPQLDKLVERMKGKEIGYQPGGKMYEVGIDADPAHMIDWDAKFGQQSPHVQERLGPLMEKSVADQHAAIERTLARNSNSLRPLWSRPLSPVERARYEANLEKGVDDLTGKQLYSRVGQAVDNHSEDRAYRAATNQLMGMNIPGLRYLDAGSRGPGSRMQLLQERIQRDAATGNQHWIDELNTLKQQPLTSNYVMFDDKPIGIQRKYAKGGPTDIAPRAFMPRKADGGELGDGDQAAMMPETYVNPLANALVRTPEYMARGVGKLIDTARETPYGLRRTDVTDLPGSAQPIDKLIGPSLEMGLNTMGTGAIAGVPVKGAEALLGSGPVRRIADDTGSAAPRGLQFPPEEAADRLRLKLQREEALATKGKPMPGAPLNERTVLKAPEGSGLPDFATGKITPEDWRARTEHMMTPDEIHSAAAWYDGIYDQFLKQAKGDEDKASKYMRSWLVAQQNVDVSGAMQNALLQREQVLRGVPEDKMIAAGMPNPTIAARRVFQEQPIEGGVGHKISDFVDAAEGKDVRSWMNNDPRGGAPFVVDVHTARDTGLLDQRMINHLERLGYDPEQIKKLKVDWGGPAGDSGGLKGPTYENRAQFGRDLTQHLNEQNWMGRSDWKPHEIQAIGWMGMTKLTANKAEDVATGLSNNMRHLSMELSPGEGSPWATKYGERFAALPPQAQWDMTHAMTQSAIDRASQLAGVDVRDIVHGTGGWMNYQNPSTVAQAFASKQGAEIAANALGHMLQQTEVWSNKIKLPTANPKGFAVDILGSGDHRLGTDDGLRELWGKIMQADPTGKLFQGYQPIVGKDGQVGIRALIDRGGAKTKADLENALSGPIENVLKGLPGHYDTHLAEAEITKARNDWTKDKNGNGYTSRLADLLGRNPTADLGRHGSELEEEFRKALEAAEGAASQKGGLTPRASGGRVGYDDGGAAWTDALASIDRARPPAPFLAPQPRGPDIPVPRVSAEGRRISGSIGAPAMGGEISLQGSYHPFERGVGVNYHKSFARGGRVTTADATNRVLRSLRRGG